MASKHPPLKFIKTLSSLIILWSLVSCSSAQDPWLTDPSQAPSNSYIQIFGDSQEAKTISCRAKSFRTPDGNKTVSLMGMIHMAQPSFYRESSDFVNKHKLSLNEGVYGKPSLSLHHFIIQYISAYFDRIEYYTKLVPQSLYFKPNIAQRNADLSLQEFSNESSLYNYFIQAISLPIIIIGGESSNALLYIKKIMSFDYLFEQNKIKNSNFDRKIFFSGIQQEDQHSDKILPGIISKRNQHLLNILDEELEKEHINSIVIPWGAAHMPDIEKSLLQKGYIEMSTNWYTAIDLRANKLNKSFYFYIPYLAYIYDSNKGKKYSFLFSSIQRSSNTTSNSTSLLWHLLLSESSGPKSYYLSILPRIFDRPLFFDYYSDTNERKFRYLLFFELNFN